ncbi:MAG TPA: hypothetical protein VG757_01900 [Devosia sp.]|nr:hypothetical protein [Devosia sp.]
MARSLTYRDFQAFVDEKGLETPCHECGATDWQMLGGEDNPAGSPPDTPMFLASLPELIDGPFPAPRAFATYVMFCGNCGVLKLVAAPVVWDWLEKRGG